MKYLLYISLLFSVTFLDAQNSEAFRKTAPEPGPTPAINIGQSESFELSNGLKVFVVTNRKIPMVSWSLTLDPPQLIVEGAKAGVADLAGSLMKKGTSTKKKSEIDETVDFLGASFVTYSTGLYASSLTKHQDKLLSVVSDVLLNPSFPEEEFEKEKNLTVSGLAANEKDPSAISSTVRKKILYNDHPYGEVTTTKTLANITNEDIKSYYKKFFKPNYGYLIIVGDIDLETAKKKAKMYFGDWKKGTIEELKFEVPKAPSKNSLHFAHKDGAVQSIVSVSYPIDLKPGTEDVVPAMVANKLFGGYHKSILNTVVREEKGYSYGVRSYISSDLEVGSFTASGSVRNEVTDSTISLFQELMAKMSKGDFEEAKLEEAKMVMMGNFSRSLENPKTIGTFALNQVRYNLPDDYYKTYLQKIAAVSKEDIVRVSKKYINPNASNIIVVGDKAIVPKLMQFSPDETITYYDPFGNELKPMKESTEEVSVDNIIADYVEALGGKSKIEALKNIQIDMSADSPMGKILMKTTKDESGKFIILMESSGMIIQKQLFDGENASISVMGNAQPIPDDAKEEFASQGAFFPMLEYHKKEQLVYEEMEMVSDKPAYKLKVLGNDKKVHYVYFDKESKMKVKEFIIVEAEGQQNMITTVFSDFKPTEGVLFPNLLQISGGLPIPVDFKVNEVLVNQELGADYFK